MAELKYDHINSRFDDWELAAAEDTCLDEEELAEKIISADEGWLVVEDATAGGEQRGVVSREDRTGLLEGEARPAAAVAPLLEHDDEQHDLGAALTQTRSAKTAEHATTSSHVVYSGIYDVLSKNNET